MPITCCCAEAWSMRLQRLMLSQMPHVGPGACSVHVARPQTTPRLLWGVVGGCRRVPVEAVCTVQTGGLCGMRHAMAIPPAHAVPAPSSSLTCSCNSLVCLFTMQAGGCMGCNSYHKPVTGSSWCMHHKPVTGSSHGAFRWSCRTRQSAPAVRGWRTWLSFQCVRTAG